jgi:hypothetical protein
LLLLGHTFIIGSKKTKETLYFLRAINVEKRNKLQVNCPDESLRSQGDLNIGLPQSLKLGNRFTSDKNNAQPPNFKLVRVWKKRCDAFRKDETN